MRTGKKLSKRKKKSYVLKVSISVHCISGMSGNSHRLKNPGSKPVWRPGEEGRGGKLADCGANVSLPVSWT